MQITLVRSGGLAGLRTDVSVNTDELPRKEAAEIAGLVHQVGLEDLARRSPIRGRGADRFQYDLTVQDAEQRLKATVAEDAASPELQQLISRLLQLPRSG